MTNSARWPAIIGLSLTGTGLLMLSRINIDIGRPELIAGMMVMAAGLGLASCRSLTGGCPPCRRDLGLREHGQPLVSG